MSFIKFSTAVAAQLRTLTDAGHELFVVGHDNRAFERHYLTSFPEGSNPVFKTRTEHDCSCCKNFIRNLGNVVAIADGRKVSVWHDLKVPEPYATVAKAMAAFVESQPITNLFRTKFAQFGAEVTRSSVDGKVTTWDHFHGTVPRKYVHPMPDTVTGQWRTNVQVLTRALTELKLEHVDTLLGLIKDNNLYRGEQYNPALRKLRLALFTYNQCSAEVQALLPWAMAVDRQLVDVRNSAVGTMLVGLAEGKDLEDVVRAYEVMVAPSNYQRPKALVTPAMIDKALADVEKLGLTDALQRRFARLSDVSVNNVLWVDGNSKGQMKPSLADILKGEVTRSVNPDKIKSDNISVDDFVRDVLPAALNLKLLVRNHQQNNLVSLTAPVVPNSGRLFKWTNQFGWSYRGEVTDSIKDRVKKAGGNVDNAAVRFSLAWFNYDDLDLHVYEPGGKRIYFGAKRGTWGELDVDMNAGGGGPGRGSRTPVENVAFKQLRDGEYRAIIHQYRRVESVDVGCVLEVAVGGQVQQLVHRGPLTSQHPAVTLTIKNGQLQSFIMGSGWTGGSMTQDVWGIKTETFVPVTSVMYSPNHWDTNAIGAKHVIFALDQCRNPEPTRGIYNEFLSAELHDHRKVFELLGDKTKCAPSEDQISGLGFTSARGDTATVEVTSPAGTRVFTINF